MKVKRFAILAAFCAVQAQAEDADLIAFLSPLGCAIGPATIVSAAEAGFSVDEMKALAAKAVLQSNGTLEGDWVVLSDAICTIGFPNIMAPIGWDDPEVQAAIGAIDEYPDNPGCFLNGEAIYKGLETGRGWDVDRANWAYLQFLAAGLASGELRFYSTSPLVTPPGIQVMTGACADVPNADAMVKSRAVFVSNFDALVRLSAERTVCETGATPWLSDPALLPDPSQTNAWSAMELTFMVMGGGWYEGISGTQKGAPRPPLCHYE